MATVYYKIVDLDQYLSDVESQLNTLGTSGWELSTIFNEQAILISGSSGISVTGSVTLPAGVVSSSAQVKANLPTGVVSSSTQAAGWTVLSSSFATTASYAATSSYVPMSAVQTSYGQWYSTETQSGSAHTALPMHYNSQSFARGFTYSGSRIYALNDGVYNLQFSAQFYNTANTNAKIDVWLRQDGNNVTDSNTLYEIDKQPNTRGTTVAALNYMTQMNSGSYVEIVWNDGNSGTVQLFYSASVSNPDRPATPSVITTITQIA